MECLETIEFVNAAYDEDVATSALDEGVATSALDEVDACLVEAHRAEQQLDLKKPIYIGDLREAGAKKETRKRYCPN